MHIQRPCKTCGRIVDVTVYDNNPGTEYMTLIECPTCFNKEFPVSWERRLWRAIKQAVRCGD